MIPFTSEWEGEVTTYHPIDEGDSNNDAFWQWRGAISTNYPVVGGI